MPSKTKKSYNIKHILNNSSIIVDGFLTEKILMGKGIGFGRKPGDTLPLGSEYEKSYQLLAKTNDFYRIINGYDDNVVEMVMDTIEQMMQRNTGEFTTHDLVTIADHLAAMFLRILNGEAILSFFSVETKTLYPETFKQAEEIAEIILENHKVDMPEGEVAYIALYLENVKSDGAKREVEKMSSILSQLDDLFSLEEYSDIDRDSMAYSRFLIHIRLVVRIDGARKTSLSRVISNAVLTTYTGYRLLAEKIIEIIESEAEYKLKEAELVYLIIHLVNLFNEEEVEN